MTLWFKKSYLTFFRPLWPYLGRRAVTTLYLSKKNKQNTLYKYENVEDSTLYFQNTDSTL